MRIVDKLDLISRIGRELQARFGYKEIDALLAEFGVPAPQDVQANSKWVYVKEALKGVETSAVLRIAEELDLPSPSVPSELMTPPDVWSASDGFRLFISHISSDKEKAIRLKACLEPYGIVGFVAHEDIVATASWQKEIERGLRSMDAFLAVMTRGFSASCWTQQEIGFAVARGVKIIALKLGEDPTGFLGADQALLRKSRTAEQLADEIRRILSADERTAERLKRASRVSLDEEIPF